MRDLLKDHLFPLMHHATLGKHRSRDESSSRCIRDRPHQWFGEPMQNRDFLIPKQQNAAPPATAAAARIYPTYRLLK
jgi:hypothetical protein